MVNYNYQTNQIAEFFPTPEESKRVARISSILKKLGYGAIEPKVFARAYKKEYKEKF